MYMKEFQNLLISLFKEYNVSNVYFDNNTYRYVLEGYDKTYYAYVLSEDTKDIKYFKEPSEYELYVDKPNLKIYLKQEDTKLYDKFKFFIYYRKSGQWFVDEYSVSIISQFIFEHKSLFKKLFIYLKQKYDANRVIIKKYKYTDDSTNANKGIIKDNWFKYKIYDRNAESFLEIQGQFY